MINLNMHILGIAETNRYNFDNLHKHLLLNARTLYAVKINYSVYFGPRNSNMHFFIMKMAERTLPLSYLKSEIDLLCRV